ncbi:MAG: single-stranded DNA-binding protein [Chloroflexota bacterium]|nr:single-stranded DNA-binding protein [Chloroflexota bacterium]
MYQQVTLIGNVGNAPEMRYTPSGTAVTNFSLAVNKRWTGADGQTQEKTTWFRIAAWERKAETVNQYVTKGSRVMVVGEIDEAKAFTDRDGNLRASIEIKAFDVKFLDNRNQERDSTSAVNGAGQQETPEEVAADIPF